MANKRQSTFAPLSGDERQAHQEPVHRRVDVDARWCCGWGLGLRAEGVGFRVEGFVLGVEGVGLRVEGMGLRVEGAGLRVEGVGLRV